MTYVVGALAFLTNDNRVDRANIPIGGGVHVPVGWEGREKRRERVDSGGNYPAAADDRLANEGKCPKSSTLLL